MTRFCKIFRRKILFITIERVIKELGKSFGDGSQIIYVNGSIRGGSRLGDLMHDFFCRNPSDMKNKPLATRTKFVKNNEKEAQGMSDFMEQIRTETLLENIRALMDSFKMSAEEVMTGLKIPPEKQKELALLI